MGPTYTSTLLVLDLSRHLFITASADAVARRELRQGLHTLPADVLLAPGTDNQELVQLDAQVSDFSDVPFRLNFMLFSEKNHVKALKNQWVLPRP